MQGQPQKTSMKNIWIVKWENVTTIDEEREIVWDFTNADFFESFHKVAVVWIPCCCFLLTIPVEVHVLQTCSFDRSNGNTMKLVNSSMLVLLSILDCVYRVINCWSRSNLSSMNLISATVKSLTTLLVFSFIKAQNERGVTASVLLFVFWFLQVVAQVIVYRYLCFGVMVYPHVCYALFVGSFPLTILQMILFAFNVKRTVKPDETNSNKPPPCPEGRASLFSRWLFSWVNSLIVKGFHRPLTAGDLWALDAENVSTEICRRFDRRWEKEQVNRGSEASLVKSICLAFGAEFLYCAGLKLICDLLVFGNPLVLRRMIKFVSSEEPNWHGYYYSSLMFIFALLQSLIINQQNHRMQYVGTRIKTALVLMVYRKALRMTIAVKRFMPLGEIINLMAVDSQQVIDMIVEIGFHWSAPLQLAAAIFLLWRLLGPAALFGLLVMIFFIPTNTFIASIIKKMQVRMMKFRDMRLKTTHEVLSGVKVLKLYAWEMSFYHIISNIRNKELAEMVKIAYVRTIMVFLFQITPILVTLATFGSYVLLDTHNNLDATKVFVSLSLLHVMRPPLNSLPTVIMLTIQGVVALRRLSEFMNADEVKPSDIQHEDLGAAVIVTEDASFSWAPNEPPTVLNVSFRVLSGQFVVLVGPVGSGKSSLLAALLGELNKISGFVNVRGEIAYVPQQAWIKNATIQKNILFGKPMNEDYYDQVLQACALYPDLEILPGRDYTEIGEKGVNVSGGQKQRVSLARAIFSDSDIYLLDDPLSAVDSNVGQHMLENAIGPNGLLNKKTRILATHSVACLPLADMIIVMKHGHVTEFGTFPELLRSQGEFSEFLVTYLRPTSQATDAEMQKLEEEKNLLLLNTTNKELQRELMNTISWIKQLQQDFSPYEGFYKRRRSFTSKVTSNSYPKQVTNIDQTNPIIQPEIAEASRSTLEVMQMHNVDFNNHVMSTCSVSLSSSYASLHAMDSTDRQAYIDVTLGSVPQNFEFGNSFVQMAEENRNALFQTNKNDRLCAGVEYFTHTSRRTGIWQQLSAELLHFYNDAPEEQVEPLLNPSSSSPVLHISSSLGKLVKRLSASELEERSKLITEETAETGVVSWNVYYYYIRSLSLLVCIISMSLFLASEACSAGGNVWLSKWSNDKPLEDGEQDVALRNWRLSVYASLGFGQALFMLFGTFVLAYGTLRASRLLHKNLLLNIMRSPMEFFDVSPVGRLMNRFAKDMEGVDEAVPRPLRPLLTHFVHLCATIFVISQNIPPFLIVTPFLLVFYIFIQRVYLRTARQLKRLEAISRSPIYAQFSETISGLPTIRAYHQQATFVKEAEVAIDMNQILTYPRIAVKRWLALRLDFVGNIIVISSGVFVTYSRNTIGPAVVGLVLTYALQVTHLLSGLVRFASDWENSIVAVERVKEYTETPQEGSCEMSTCLPPSNWPHEGRIVFDNFSVRYRENLEPALKDLNFQIEGGEKVGIVGRTGAGKTSITLALFRIIEPSTGTIYIDDVDITHLGLQYLRTRITIIPQDPVLFSGSLRLNLDPMGIHSEEEIIAVLQVANLMDFFKMTSNVLEYEVTESGENLSIGQQQLICLARALLRKPKVLVLDEATAAIDLETDILIQGMIRKEFANCTILTIAHRLNTILDYNRVLVLANGEVKEFDTPEKLLKNEDSIFYSMAKEAGVLKADSPPT